MWYDLFIIALSGHLSRDFCSIPKQTLQWTGVRNSLFLGGCQTVLPSKIHNVLQSIRYQGTRYRITPYLSFEVGKINNSLCITKEDMKRQKKIAFSAAPPNIICDYTLQFLLCKSVSEMLLIRNFVISTIWNDGSRYAEERIHIAWHSFLTKGKKIDLPNSALCF